MRDVVHGAADAVVIIARGLPHDDVFRIDLVDGDAAVIEGVVQARIADDIGAASRTLAADKTGCGQRAGVEMTLIHLKAHARQLLLQLLGGFAA